MKRYNTLAPQPTETSPIHLRHNSNHTPTHKDTQQLLRNPSFPTKNDFLTDRAINSDSESHNQASITFLDFKKAEVSIQEDGSTPHSEKECYIIFLSKMHTGETKSKLSLFLSFFTCYTDAQERFVCHMEEGDQTRKLKEDISIYAFSRNNIQFVFIDLKEFHRQVDKVNIYKSLTTQNIKVAHIYLARDWLLPKASFQAFLEPLGTKITQQAFNSNFETYFAYIKQTRQIPKEEEIIFQYGGDGLYFAKTSLKKGLKYSVDVMTEMFQGFSNDNSYSNNPFDQEVQTKDKLPRNAKTDFTLQLQVDHQNQEGSEGTPVNTGTEHQSNANQVKSVYKNLAFKVQNTNEISKEASASTTSQTPYSSPEKEENPAPKSTKIKKNMIKPLELKSAGISDFDSNRKIKIDNQSSASVTSRMFEKHLLKEEDLDLDITTLQTSMTEEMSEENRKSSLRQKGLENYKWPQELISPRHIGSSCYINVVLCCLFNAPNFSQGFMKDYSDIQSLPKKDKPLSYILAELIKKSRAASSQLLSSQKRYEEYDSLLSDLKSLILNTNPTLKKSGQCEALRFMETCLELLNEELQQSSKPDWRHSTISENEEHDYEEESELFGSPLPKKKKEIVTDLFYGEIVDMVKCKQCNSKKVFSEYCWNLSMKLKSKDSKAKAYFLPDLLANFAKEKNLVNDLPFCETCFEECEATCKSSLSKLPEILIIDFERLQEKTFISTENKVQFPIESLDLSGLIKGSEDKSINNPVYTLFGIVTRHGKPTNNTYTAEYRSLSTREWFHFNGSSFEASKIKADSEEYCCCPSVLFYAKRSSMDEDMFTRKTVKLRNLNSRGKPQDFRETVNNLRNRKHKRYYSEGSFMNLKDSSMTENSQEKGKPECGCF